MSGQSKFSRSLVAAVAALMVSSVTVAAAVGPAHASAGLVTTIVQKNLHA